MHADLGPHSAHCAADRGLSQVQFLAGCGRACCCAVTGALVGRAENCGVSAVAVVWASSSSWTSRCARLCNDWGRAMLGSTVDTCSVLLRVAYERICTIFYVNGWTRILRSILVASLPVHMPKMKWPRSSSTTSVACFLAGIAGFMHLALCSQSCQHDGMHTVRSVHSRCFSYLSCTWKSVHYFYDPCVFSAFSAVEILR